MFILLLIDVTLYTSSYAIVIVSQIKGHINRTAHDTCGIGSHDLSCNISIQIYNSYIDTFSVGLSYSYVHVYLNNSA